MIAFSKGAGGHNNGDGDGDDARADSGNLTRWLVLLLGAAVFLNYVDRGAIAVAARKLLGNWSLWAMGIGH